MKPVKSLLTVIYLTIFVTSTATPAHANTIQQCIVEVCKGTSPHVRIGDFLALEKKNHPDLERFYNRYKSKLNQIRIAREKQVRESLRVLGETQKVTDSIRQMSDLALMSLFVERSPWNLGTDRANGEYIVVPKPITADPQQGEIIKQIFSRLQSVSPLFAAQLKIFQLNADPRAALRLSDSQKTDTFVINSIKKRIAQLPRKARSEYTQKLNQYLSRLANFKDHYGDKVYVLLGSLDLEVQVKFGRVKFEQNERSVVEKIMIDEIPGVIESRRAGIAKIDQIYSPATWEKTCRSAYNRALHYGLTQAEKDRVENQMKPEALRRAQMTLQGLFGTDLTSVIMEFVKTLNIGGPMSMPEYIQYIEQNMKTALDESKKADLSLLDRYEMVNSLGNDEDGVIGDLCNAWIFEPIRDSVTGKYVILSTYTAKNYAVGLSISIHEMGHVASLALDLLKRQGVSIAPYEDIRACISENYATSDRKPVYDHSHFNADKLWTEEDWADSFSGHAMQDLGVNDRCGFLGAFPQYDFVTIAERSGDTHSPTFYRILNIDAHLGNTQPNQCKQPLQNQFQGVVFKDCITPYMRK